MADFLVQSQWEFPIALLPTTQQSAAEINNRYQKVGNCAEFLRQQAILLRTAATNLLTEIDAALANFNQQQTAFNALAANAGTEVTVANSLQLSAANAVTRRTTANTSVVTAKGKINLAESSANSIITSGMPRSNNLVGIAAALPANPGILGLSANGTWTWYLAPSGSPFVIEFQVFSTEYNSSTDGGAIVANSWNTIDISTAGYGSFKNSIGFPQNVVEEFADRLKLQNFLHYWQVVALGSNTDTMRMRFLLDNLPQGRSLSTQTAAESNTAVLRQFNQDTFVDMTITPATAGDTGYLQFQTYHNSTNPAIASAARGIAGNKGYPNIYMAGYGWRVRNI